MEKDNLQKVRLCVCCFLVAIGVNSASASQLSEGFWCMMRADHMKSGGNLLIWYNKSEREVCGQRQVLVQPTQLKTYLAYETVKRNFCKLALGSRNTRTAPFIDANTNYELGCDEGTFTSATQAIEQLKVRVQPTIQPQVQLKPQQMQQTIPQLSLNITSTDPKDAIEEIDLKITLYAKIANNLPQTEAGYRVQQDVLDKKIEELKKLRESLAASYLSKYNTPIYPININLGTTAFRYSEIFPSIPYYIPGTKEVGEFLVQPVVSNKGQLTYEFTFLDPSAKYNKEREQIVVVNTDMSSLIDGLDKVREWTETAEKNNVRRRYEKVATCFPKADCGERQVGKASTEVVFQIYENGSTAGKLQRVKGEFVSGFNMSVESTVLLGAYLKYMRDIGEREFKIGSMSEKDLDTMFK